MQKFIALAILLSLPLIVQAKSKPLPFEKYPIVIGCHNPATGVTKAPMNKSAQDGACYYGRGWKNILLPSASQFKDLKTVFDTKGGIITAITLISHESQWDSNAKGCHKGGCDHGLLQIRDIYGGAKMTDKQQMEWFKTRKEWQMSPQGNCYHRVQEGNKENLLRCVFARHNGQLLGTSKYSTDRYREWLYINTYLKNYDL